MMSISEYIRHYQRSIERSVRDEARLLHCLDKLTELPMNVKCLQETKIGRTVNDLRKHDGVVGQKATALMGKWKKEVAIVENAADLSNKDERLLYGDETENVRPSTRNKCTDSRGNVAHNSRLNSDLCDQSSSVGCSADSNTSESNSEKKSSKNGDGKTMFESHRGTSCSTSKSDGKRENSKREDGRETNDKKRRRESDLIDIDCTMGTSFADALRMLDEHPTTSKTRKLSNGKASKAASTSSKQEGIGNDETPILLTERPKLRLGIAVDSLSRSTVMESETQPKRQTTQLTDSVTNTISRSTKTKVFSGNNAGLKCKVSTLFQICIKILQENIDLLEYIGGVPFDILRPILERATCEQLMTLEDYNPYLMEDTHCLWEQHCKRRFRTKSREELETWRDMYIRCLDEEQAKFNSLTAIIKVKVSKERQTKPAFVETHSKAIGSKKVSSGRRSETVTHAGGNRSSSVDESRSQSSTKSKDSKQIPKRSKKSNDDPDWTPTTWYKTLYKKVRDSKPKAPKQHIKKNIDMLRYDRAKALEKEKRNGKEVIDRSRKSFDYKVTLPTEKDRKFHFISVSVDSYSCNLFKTNCHMERLETVSVEMFH